MGTLCESETSLNTVVHENVKVYMSTFESNVELSKIFKIDFFNCFGTVSRFASIADLCFNLSKNVTQLAVSKVQDSSYT